MSRIPLSRVDYPVWDRTTRWFHWINVLCVVGLICLGTVILFAGDLGVPNDGKILLKTTHVTVGYVFVLNLLWRIVWGFIGGPYSRWTALLPGGRGYLRALLDNLRGLHAGNSLPHAGHSPSGSIAVTVIFAALLVQGSSGLVLAGTDVYMPPFGHYFAQWVAGADGDAATVRPYAPETVDEGSYDEMRAFRSPFVTTHETTYYLLLALIVSHIAAVIFVDVRERGSIISAMFTGRKTLPREPE